MLIYFTIGIVVEIWTIIMRVFVRKIYIDREGWNIWTYLGFAFGFLINTLIWPITVIAEIFNIKNGV